MAPQDAAVRPEAEAMSELSRLGGVFFDPAKTFADIARRPSWIVPLVLWLLAAIGVTGIYSQHVGWERMVRHRLETSPQGQQMSPDQREQQIAVGARVAPLFGYAGVLVGLPLYCLIAAGIFTGLAAGVMSAPVRFKQVFAIFAYANLPGVLVAVLTVVTIFLKNPDDFDLQNPLMFNAGAFMDPQQGSKFLYSAATSIDLFSFWVMLLTATGLKAAAGKKLSFGGALFVVVLPWAVYVLIKSALAGVFG
jgi:Yip1 domain